MAKLRTSLIKPRTQGGTFYTFSSALEDVGLNINELKNKVSLSHYILLDIPTFNKSNTQFHESLNKGDYSFAEQFQNYVLNMETVLRNQDSYNFAESLSVSERVFWKWMQKNGWINFKKDSKDSKYWIDEYTFEENSVIKGFGTIAAGAQRSDAYGIYNETFVQIPSSYGQMKVLFKSVNDKNYYKKDDGFLPSNVDGYIENISPDEYENDILHTGLSAKAIYDNDQKYFIENDTDELCAEFSLSELRKYYNDETLSYDDIGIATSENIRSSEISGDYKFNAVLVYYSIYDSTTKNILATNAYGLLILDSAIETSDNKFRFNSLIKKQSSVKDQGNAYSFRLNIKTTSVYNGDIITNDNSVPGYQMSTDFNDTIRNLAVAVETLKSNANLIAVLNDGNTTTKQLVIKTLDALDNIQADVNSLKSGKLRKLNIAELVAGYADISSLDSSVSIGDYGSFDSSVFSYENIIAKTINANNGKVNVIEVSNINPIDEDIIFGDDDVKISSSGVYTTTTHFRAEVAGSTNDMTGAFDSSTAISIFDGIKIKEDATLIIPNYIDNDDPGIEMNTMLEMLGIHNQADEPSNTYVSIKVIIAILISKIKSTNSLLLNLVPASGSSEITPETWIECFENIFATIEDLKNKITNLETDIQTAFSEIHTHIDSSINDISNKIESIDSSVDEVYIILEDASTAFKNIDSSIFAIDSSISAIYEEIFGIRETIEKILS